MSEHGNAPEDHRFCEGILFAVVLGSACWALAVLTIVLITRHQNSGTALMTVLLEVFR